MLPLTRLGLVGDPHAEHDLLDVALAFLAGARVDALWCTGDVLDGKGSAERCIQALRAAGALCVRGNHERWYLKGTMRGCFGDEATPALELAAQAWVAALAPQVEVETVAGRALLCHGMGPDEMAGVQPDDGAYALEANGALQRVLNEGYRVVVAGHTHRRMVRTHRRCTFVNPGSLVRNEEPGFAVLDLAERAVTFLDLVRGAAVPRATVPFAQGYP